MIIATIKFSKYFKETDEWLGTEVTPEPGDSSRQCWLAAFAEVENAHAMKWGGAQLEKPIPEEERLARMVADIMSCTTLGGEDGLYSFAMAVESENKKDIRAAYDLKLAQIQKQKKHKDE